MLFVVSFNFFLFRIMPSDPVAILTRVEGKQLSQTERQQKIEELGLDEPLVPQFFDYLGDLARFDLGTSLLYAAPVSEVFLEFLWPTLLLVGVSTVFTIVIGLYMGIRGGWRRGSKGDLASMGVSLVFYSMPEFWLGMMLLTLFATTLGWFPQGGFETIDSGLTGFPAFVDILNHMFLPALTLTLAYVGEYYILMRSSLLDVLGEDYITTVRAKGVRENKVLWRHAVRNALLPTVALVALSFGFVIGGALTVEIVFSYPGVGNLTLTALDAQDYQLLQGMFLFFSLAVVLANLAADLLYGRLDPRVQEA